MPVRHPMRPAATALTALVVLLPISFAPTTVSGPASSTSVPAESGATASAATRSEHVAGGGAGAVTLTRAATLAGSRQIGTRATGDPSHYALFPQSYDYRTRRMVTNRWEPCRYISFKVNPGSLGATGLSEVRTAAARISARTGIRLAYAGSTTHTPRGTANTRYVVNGETYYDWDADDQRTNTGVPLVIALTTRAGSNLFTGGEVGLGGFQTSSSTSLSAHISDGFVLAQTDRGLPPGFQPGASRGSLLLHELAHAFGLDHYDDPTVVMNPSLSASTPADYAPGDITGLSKVGREQGCINPSWVTEVRTSRRPGPVVPVAPAVHTLHQSR